MAAVLAIDWMQVRQLFFVVRQSLIWRIFILDRAGIMVVDMGMKKIYTLSKEYKECMFEKILLYFMEYGILYLRKGK